ncbi:hypothetical protein I8G32_03316 [Rhodopseudomonas palustris]|nr:hypothetical protein I8G32_03316 [Rhodopseudomonas palustris]
MSRSDPLMSRGTARAFTSPRVRGEVAHRTQFDERVRGASTWPSFTDW